MALQRGLDAAIMNPLSEQMMRTYRSYCVLSGWDESCMDYIVAYGQEQAPVPKASAANASYTLREAIERGLERRGPSGCEKLLCKPGKA